MADTRGRSARSSRAQVWIIRAGAMVALLGVLAREHPAPVSRIRSDPVLWWYVARGSGLVAWALLSASVVGGLGMSARLTRGRARRWIQRCHEFIGPLAVGFTAIHLGAVLGATPLRVGVVQLLVPFTKPDNPAAQGCGVIAVYLLTAVMLTSWMRAVLPWRWWRRMHRLALPLWGCATGHTVLAGSDITNPVAYWGGLAVTGVVVALAVLRLSAAARSRIRPAPAGTPVTAQERLPASWSSAGGPGSTGIQLIIGETTRAAENVLSLRLDSPDGAALPGWEPGAHLELALPSGRRRQYSLCGEPTDTRSYRIAVLRLPAGRGGSVELHAIARPGQLITVHGPRNHFPLVTSPSYLFIAGGIGITAMMTMAARAAATGGEWMLVYTGRSRGAMAFADEVQALDPDRVEVLASDEHGRPDLPAIINAAPPGTAVYCCGPERMLHAVRDHVRARGDLSLHSERFTGTTASSNGADSAFQVELHRSRSIIDVPAHDTILHALRAALPAIPAGCEQGVCGICRARILAGEPDHRDELLSPADRAAGAILICVSRARTQRLTLDL